MNPAKWLQTATSTTELTLFHSIRLARLVRLVRLVRSCFVKNAPRFARRSYFWIRTEFQPEEYANINWYEQRIFAPFGAESKKRVLEAHDNICVRDDLREAGVSAACYLRL